MSSVESQKTCPDCNCPEAFEEFNVRTNASIFFCPFCGRSEDHDWLTGHRSVSKGKGVASVVTKQRTGATWGFHRSKSLARRLADLKKWAASPRKRLISLTVTSKSKAGQWEMHWIVGSPPKRKAMRHKVRMTTSQGLPYCFELDDDIPL